jgi:EAL domain-containing protein (putative c-di-GMP-specific phosphodiesterase class I)
VSESSGEKGRLIVVEDEAELRILLERLLTKAGFEVVTAEDGQVALEIVRAGNVHTVISDIMMPNMDGISLLSAIRETDLDLPVILMTGAPDVDTAIKAVSLGAFHYFKKPFRTDEVVKMAEKATFLYRMAHAKRQALPALGLPGFPVDRAGLESSFSAALEKLFMAYQPLVSAGEKKIVAYEALMRSGDKRLPHPPAVLRAAEQLGRIDDVLPRVAAHAAKALEALDSEIALFLNLHPRDLMDDRILADGFPLADHASQVVLEVTERSSLDNIADLSRRIEDLRKCGYRVAVDDLGAGYASLTSFAHLEPDFVKLDMGLVRGICESPVKQKLVSTVITLCHEMDIVVVAEGVEYAKEREKLGELGVDLLQGYLFAKPGPAFPEVDWKGH